METTYDIMTWCEEAKDHTSALQDICLDHIDDPECIAAIKRLTEIQEELEDLSAQCKNILF